MFQHLISFCTELLGADKLDDPMMYRNKDEFTCLQYATHLKQKEIFLAILESKREEIWSWGPVSRVAYPLEEVDTHGDNVNSVLGLLH